MKPYFTNCSFKKKNRVLVTLLLLVLTSSVATAQLGVYSFTGVPTCPNINNNVTSQPPNATFSPYTSTGVICFPSAVDFENSGWSTGLIALNKYNEFNINAAPGYGLILNSIVFSHSFAHPSGGTWSLRSNFDNYSTDIATGFSGPMTKTDTVNLPSNLSNNTGPDTFRLYLYGVQTLNQIFTVDEVKINGSVYIRPTNPTNPTSNSPQCQTPGVILTQSGSAPVGETWYWQTSASGTSTTNSSATYTATVSGTYYVRSQDNTTLGWSIGNGSLAVTVILNVGMPVFTLGPTSTRCQGAGTVTYAATATNNTGLTYSLDAASLTYGNTIDAATGAVTYLAGWTGSSVITVTATGCNGPTTTTHTATTNSTVTRRIE